MTTNRRDQAIADETNAKRSLMCCAPGCPNAWCVDAGKGHACSAHAWSSRHLWPQITQEQLDAETDRAQADAMPKPEPRRFSADEKREILARARDVLTTMNLNPRAWVQRLLDRHARGEELSRMQRHALEQVGALPTSRARAFADEVQP